MTAGQRNCYLILDEYLHAYGLDNVVFALGEHVSEIMDGRKPATWRPAHTEALRNLKAHIEEFRAAMIINPSDADPLVETP